MCERSERALILATRTKLSSRIKTLAQYDAKITTQENIANGILIYLFGTDASQVPGQFDVLVANTLPSGPIHIDTWRKEFNDFMATLNEINVMPLAEQYNALMEEERNLDSYEESISLREWAVVTLLKLINKEEQSKGSAKKDTDEDQGSAPVQTS